MKSTRIFLFLSLICTSIILAQENSDSTKITSSDLANTNALKSRLPEYLEPYDADKHAYKYWMTIGFGGNGDVFAGNLAYNFSWNSFFGKVGYHTYGDELITRFHHGDHEFRAFDFSVGQRLKSRWVNFTAFQGVSMAQVEESLKPGETKKFYTPGLQTELQVILKPADELGMGIGILANLNPVHSYAVVTANLSLSNGK